MYPEEKEYNLVSGTGQEIPRLRQLDAIAILRRRKIDLEEKLAEINHALDLLEKNPQLTELLIAVERARM